MTEEEEIAADAVMIADLQIIAACGSSYYSSAVADVAMAAVVMVAVVTTAACESSYYSSAVADLEMDAVMDADVDAVMTVAKP